MIPTDKNINMVFKYLYTYAICLLLCMDRFWIWYVSWVTNVSDQLVIVIKPQNKDNTVPSASIESRSVGWIVFRSLVTGPSCPSSIAHIRVVVAENIINFTLNLLFLYNLDWQRGKQRMIMDTSSLYNLQRWAKNKWGRVSHWWPCKQGLPPASSEDNGDLNQCAYTIEVLCFSLTVRLI